MLKSLMTPPLDTVVGAESFRNALRQFASGVTVITTRDERGHVHGMTATAFSSLSLDPPLVMIAVARGSRCHKLLMKLKRFGISFLSADQVELSRHFGGSPDPHLRPAYADLNEVAVLEGAIAKLSCRLDQAFEGGDHSIFTGLVIEAEIGRGAPLIHFDGRYHAVMPRPGA